MSKIWVTRGELRAMVRDAARLVETQRPMHGSGMDEGGCPDDCECEGCRAKRVSEAKGRRRKANPWAVCHSSTGPGKTDRFERCVMHVKRQQGEK